MDGMLSKKEEEEEEEEAIYTHIIITLDLLLDLHK
jgi:hypothetical protein